MGSKIGQMASIFDRGNGAEGRAWKDVSKLGKGSSHKYWGKNDNNKKKLMLFFFKIFSMYSK